MYHSQVFPELFGMRVVKYIRCSTENQVKEGETLEAQNAILDEFIKSNKLQLIDTFVDEALSARKKYTTRKEFMRLLDGVQRREFDLIIFTKLDRWFRNIRDYHNIQEILEENNVMWKSVTEQYDTTSTNGRLYINIRLAVAQDECDRDGDRIRDVFDHKLKNRSYICGNLPKGLKLDEEKHIIIDEEWRQYVLDLFDYFELTNSKHRTLVYLKEKYHLPRLSYGTIVNCIKNKLYKGQYRDDPEFCPAIIDPERFDRIQIMAQRDVRNAKRTSYIFTSLIKCSSCGFAMHGHTCRRTLASGEEKVYRFYSCTMHYNNHSCDRNETAREEEIEQALLDSIRPAIEAHIVQFDATIKAKVQCDPQANVMRIKRRIKKLYDLFMEDLIDKEMYRSEYDALQEELKTATAASSIATPASKLEHLKELLESDWQDIYATLSHDEKSAFWKSFIDYIVLHKDKKIDIYFL